MDADDVIVLERCLACLAFEAHDGIRTGRHLRLENFEGHDSIKAALTGPEHPAKAAAAEFRESVEIANLAERRGHGRRPRKMERGRGRAIKQRGGIVRLQLFEKRGPAVNGCVRGCQFQFDGLGQRVELPLTCSARLDVLFNHGAHVARQAIGEQPL